MQSLKEPPGPGLGAQIPPLHVTGPALGAQATTFVAQVAGGTTGAIVVAALHEPPMTAADALAKTGAVPMQPEVNGEQLIVRGPIAQACALLHVAPVVTVAIGVPQVTPLGVPQAQAGHIAGGATGMSPPVNAALVPAGHAGAFVAS
jgi:hypothetical protein